jgi:hypothetical protein
MIKKEDLVIREEESECAVADARTMDIQYLIENLLKKTGIVHEVYLKFPKSCLNEVLEVLRHDAYLTDNLKNVNFTLNTYDTHISLTFNYR